MGTDLEVKSSRERRDRADRSRAPEGRRLKNVATEMALNVLGYNLTRVMNIVGVKPLLAAMRA